MRREVITAMPMLLVTDRILFLKVQGSPININIIQVYSRRTDYENSEVEVFYEKLEEVRGHAKSHEKKLVMGSLNAKVGEGREVDLVWNLATSHTKNLVWTTPKI